MRFTILLYILVFTLNFAYTQNVVPNPSFEQYKVCPNGNGFGEIVKLKDWYEVKTSADYYNCGAGVPNNLFGYQTPNTGTGYVGFGSGESIGVKLNEALEFNKDYLVEFYVSLGNSGTAPLALENVGIYLSRDSICLHSDAEYNLQVKSSDSLIIDTLNWVKVSAIYKAKGCENYIALVINGTQYYYFDDISIVCADSLGCKNMYCNYIDSIAFPNVFTPNGDYNNDNFHINFPNSEPSDFKCEIYNRWGNKVAEINYPKTYWDGKNNKGKKLPEGVYYYFLSATYTICGDWLFKKGFIHILK